MKKLTKLTMVGAMLLMIMVAIGTSGCERKTQAPSPQETEDLHNEAEETLFDQDYLEVNHLQKVTEAVAEIVEAENVYDFTFLLADVDLWDSDSTQFALIEQMISAWYDDDRELQTRQQALADELGVAIVTHPELPKIYGALDPEEVLQVHGVIMKWQPSLSANANVDTTDEARYWLVDEAGDGTWDWAACSENDTGEVKFRGAGGQCEFENVQTIELAEDWVGTSVWEVEAMFREK